MKIRLYLQSKDYEYLESWIDNERIHALWCANLLPYPITPNSFQDFLEANSAKWGDRAYVATLQNGDPVGFFSCSVNSENHTEFLKFVIIDPSKRGRGYGQEMLRLTLQHAFQVSGAEAVWLNVFYENTSARHCYEKVGFAERNIDRNAFAYKDELWDRCSMAITKQAFSI